MVRCLFPFWVLHWSFFWTFCYSVQKFGEVCNGLWFAVGAPITILYGSVEMVRNFWLSCFEVLRVGCVVCESSPIEFLGAACIWWSRVNAPRSCAWCEVLSLGYKYVRRTGSLWMSCCRICSSLWYEAYVCCVLFENSLTALLLLPWDLSFTLLPWVDQSIGSGIWNLYGYLWMLLSDHENQCGRGKTVCCCRFLCSW